MKNMTTYELPLNEHIRVCLRLEYLHQIALTELAGDTTPNHRASLSAILDIITLLDRPDLRSKLAQECRRVQTQLERFMNTPAINQEKLIATIDRLRTAGEVLHAEPGKFARSLRDNEFITSLIQYQTIPGGHCGFNTPNLIWWSQLSIPTRRVHLQKWLQELNDIITVSQFLLDLTRQSAQNQKHTASDGFFQMALNTQNAVQLLQVHLANGSEHFPQMSAGRHGMNIRFLHTDLVHPSKQINYDVEFVLGRCGI